ncbi:MULTISPECIES: hypothetical protein [Natrialbaceae]|uniref:hypothetical protein n=1 Tax=Natrialbaceae TaxID=1644061 RepID=UPI00207CB33F|nr:hypothetical protein [Natronococcus sp. CG52]
MSEIESQPNNATGPSEPEANGDERITRKQLTEITRRLVKHNLNDDDWWGDMVARGEQNLRDWQGEGETQAFNDIMGLLCGGTGTIDGLYRDDSNEKQYKVDAEALWLLYGIMRYVGENPEDAAKLAYIVYYHYCEESDGDRRFVNWPERYRQEQLLGAIDNFDRNRWIHWHRRNHPDGRDKDDWEYWSGDYGSVGYDLVLAMVDIGCGLADRELASQTYDLDLPELSDIRDTLSISQSNLFHKIPPGGSSGRSCDSSDCGYPSTQTVQEAVVEADESTGGDPLDSSSVKTIRQRLQRKGALKVAELKKGVDYRIYPASLPDPQEANRVWFEGKEYEPDVSEEDDAESDDGEQETEAKIMTDGGTRQTEAREDLERIRQAKNGEADTNDGPEIYTCPVSNCSRVIIDDPSNLRHHVRQLSDDDHAGLELTEDLDIVECSETAESRDETESSNEENDSLATEQESSEQPLSEQAYLATWGPGTTTDPSPSMVSGSAAAVDW